MGHYYSNVMTRETKKDPQEELSTIDWNQLLTPVPEIDSDVSDEAPFSSLIDWRELHQDETEEVVVFSQEEEVSINWEALYRDSV